MNFGFLPRFLLKQKGKLQVKTIGTGLAKLMLVKLTLEKLIV